MDKIAGTVTRIEAAEILGISLPTLKKRTDKGRYSVIKQGRNLMYFRESLDKSIEAAEETTENLPVPTMADLVEGNFSKELTEVQLKQRNFMVLLNNEPPTDWLKAHPNAKRKNAEGLEVPTMYLPIERVEYLLARVYTKWWVEITFPPQLIGNSVVVTVRLWVVNPITLEKEFQDGTGGAVIQTNAGAGATDVIAVKSNGVMLAAPMAETYAIKDAAEKFGKLFGKDLGRSEVIDYSTIIKKKGEKSADEIKAVELQRLKELIDAAETDEHLLNIEYDILSANTCELSDLFKSKWEEVHDKQA